MHRLGIILRGMAMGAAEVVPGVSGGTIALITGIYERILNAIHSVGPPAWKAYRQDGLPGLWRAVDGNFLLLLLGGMVIAVLLMSNVVLWGLEHQPLALWSFFLGLIAAAFPLLRRQMGPMTAQTVGLLILGTAIGAAISVVSPTEAEATPIYLFLSGAIAISAFILPGISGSFILVLLGMYEQVQQSIHDRDLGFLLIFGAGALTGLLSFARLLRWAFQKRPHAMVATMTGFIAGSLVKIYPYQIDGQAMPLLPSQWAEQTQSDPQYALVLGAATLGFLIVYSMDRLAQHHQSRTS